MFILYAVIAGLLLGLLLGGRLGRLERIQFRWAGVIAGGLLVQVVLFSGPVTERIGELGVPIYVGSTLAVLAAILANWRLTGMPLVAAGAVSNLVAIVSNGGYMPASPDALAFAGKTEATEYSNSAVVARPMFEPLSDIFAMPAWIPFSNVFSIGDVLIGLGVIVVIVVAMRAAPPAASGATPAAAAGAPRQLPPTPVGGSTKG